MEYCELEYEEVKLPLCEEDYYPSLCTLEDTKNLKIDGLTGTFFEKS